MTPGRHQDVGYWALDERIGLTRAKKTSLLMVLVHPEIPLHNDSAELDARQRVRKRKISFGPRDVPEGTRAWDTFMSLAGTTRKLGVNFYRYINDRISGANQILGSYRSIIEDAGQGTEPGRVLANCLAPLPRFIELIGKAFMLGQQSGGAPRQTSEPVPTVTTDGAISLIQPSIIEYYGQSNAREVTEPLSTILSNRKHAFVKPTLVKYYGQSHSADVDAPLPALTTKARYGLADPILVELNHGASAKGPKDDDRRSHSVDQPLGSLTTSRGLGLARPILIQTGQTGENGSCAQPPEQPVPTLTPTVKPYLVPNFGERDGQEPRIHDVDDPLPTVTSRGAGSLVSPTLVAPILREMEKANLELRPKSTLT